MIQTKKEKSLLLDNDTKLIKKLLTKNKRKIKKLLKGNRFDKTSSFYSSLQFAYMVKYLFPKFTNNINIQFDENGKIKTIRDSQ